MRLDDLALCFCLKRNIRKHTTLTVCTQYIVFYYSYTFWSGCIEIWKRKNNLFNFKKLFIFYFDVLYSKLFFNGFYLTWPPDQRLYAPKIFYNSIYILYNWNQCWNVIFNWFVDFDEIYCKNYYLKLFLGDFFSILILLWNFILILCQIVAWVKKT